MQPLPPFQTRATPNPNAYLFEFTDLEELAPWPLEARASQQPTGIELFDRLLAVEGIERVYVAGNFITAIKSPSVEWFELTVELRSVIRHHLDVAALADPVRTAALQVPPLSADQPLIHEWFARRILPATERDGGGIYARAYAQGQLTVEAVGACAGCPHFGQTVEQGIRLPLAHQLGHNLRIDTTA